MTFYKEIIDEQLRVDEIIYKNWKIAKLFELVPRIINS